MALYKEKFTPDNLFTTMLNHIAALASTLSLISDDIATTKVSPGTAGSAAANLDDCVAALEAFERQVESLRRRNNTQISIPDRSPHYGD